MYVCMHVCIRKLSVHPSTSVTCSFETETGGSVQRSLPEMCNLTSSEMGEESRNDHIAKQGKTNQASFDTLQLALQKLAKVLVSA